MIKQKKILVCPLNWGLGHATRDVPIINKLIQNGFDVLIAASGDSYKYLKREFPGLEIIFFPNYNIKYSKANTQLLKMILLVPRIIYWTIKEHQIIKRLIKKHQIDIVISDNRFGLWGKSIYSIFITHQLKVKFPGQLRMFEFVYTYLLNSIINKYDECWIPDFQGNINLSGELSHFNKVKNKTFYIGPLSRFNGVDKNVTSKNEIDVLFILSGPEPQRSIFESIIFKQTIGNTRKFVIVRGTEKESINKFQFPTHQILNTDNLLKLILPSKIVVCRSGYSSVMDLVELKKSAVLVPTPGQTEQEYLADYLKDKNLFYSMKQSAFDLEQAISNCFTPPEINLSDQENILLERIYNLKNK